MKAYAQVRDSRSTSQATQTGQKSGSSVQQSGSPAADGMLFGVFLMVVVIWLGTTFALVYHFRKYGSHDPKVKLAQGIYLFGSLLLLVVALFSIL